MATRLCNMLHPAAPRILKTCVLLLSICVISIGPSGASEKISLQLAWKHQFQFAGYYAALHKGYYREAGLDVTIVEGGEGKFAREEVLSGRVQYGVAGSELLLHRRDGDPFVVLAPIFQHSPSILLARKDSGISNLQDLIGKRVMLLPENKDADILVAFLNEGISTEAFERLDQTYNLGDLIERHTDAVSAYVTNEPWHLLQEGIEPVIISPQTYGVDFYSDCLFTTEKEINKNPGRVREFLKASLLGWEYAMAHPEEIIDLLLTEYGVKKKREHLQYEAASIEKIMLPTLVEIGHMNPGRWHHIARTYQKLGLVEADFSLEGFLYDPRPGPNYGWLKYVAYAAVVVILLSGIVSGVLFFFNRKLAAEVKERKLAEDALIQNEQRYKSAQRIGMVGNWEYDLETETFWGSDQTKRIYGFNPSSDRFTTDEVENCIPERQRVHQALVDLIKENKPYNLEFEINPVSGPKKKTIKSKAELVRNDQGAPHKVVGVVLDITEQNEIEKEKLILEKKLLQAQKMESIGNLAGGIAHDFNNILTSILGFSELALNEVETGSTMEDNLKEIYAGGLRAKEIVKQILAFARQSDEEVKPIRVDTIIIEILKLIRPSTPATIEIRQDITSSSLIMGNATQIHQIVMNLCTNAIHAMQNDGGIMEVSLKDIMVNENNAHIWGDLRKGKYVQIAISDNGYGILPEHLDLIFEPYFTTKAVGEGTGMGLAMVRGIIDSYGGRITVTSEPFTKTVFTLCIPVTSNLDHTTLPGSNELLPGGDESILFVDDEPPIARMGSRILESLGYTVTSRTSSLEALELFRTHPDRFALVITDMTMPQMTGDKLAVELKRIREDIRVILCTGYSNKISAEIAREIGISAFTYKPFLRDDLAKTVREVLDAT